MILDFESVGAMKAKKLVEELTVTKIRLEVVYAALLDRTDTNLADVISEAVETVDEALDFLNEGLKEKFTEVE